MRWGLVYGGIAVLGLVWGIVDDWAGSDAAAAALTAGGSLALAASGLMPRRPLDWAPPLLVFGTVGLATWQVSGSLAELDQPGSTLGGSGVDLVPILMMIAWVTGLVLTVVMLIRDEPDVVESDRPSSPRP